MSDTFSVMATKQRTYMVTVRLNESEMCLLDKQAESSEGNRSVALRRLLTRTALVQR